MQMILSTYCGDANAAVVMSLVGEKSNAWRILLRNDRKSRHRRIKKRRRYERLAATSHFSSFIFITMDRKKVCKKSSAKKKMMSIELKREIIEKHEQGVRVVDLSRQYGRSVLLSLEKSRCPIIVGEISVSYYRWRNLENSDQVSEFDRGRIVAYRDCGLSFREIGSRVGRNQTTVMRISDRLLQEVRIAGTLNSQRYISEVLEPVVLPYLHGLPAAIFQQHNAGPHVARIVQRFFVNRQIELLPCPARSPELLPIENMWSMVAQ
ncbi:hypothetical protein LAZ67_2002555 [Cordylochernes scorpioides]|uniref:Transposase n=1 Tax=Cordylochernes scorpioides TaxID=51811 RepID=A0ABY6K234_9ARAC|nr:hypothetical protein LAZ67_2002555 [Cordylochernes scorpioides]